MHFAKSIHKVWKLLIVLLVCSILFHSVLQDSHQLWQQWDDRRYGSLWQFDSVRAAAASRCCCVAKLTFPESRHVDAAPAFAETMRMMRYEENRPWALLGYQWQQHHGHCALIAIRQPLVNQNSICMRRIWYKEAIYIYKYIVLLP